MAISTTWSINNMVYNDSDGGVTVVYWSLVAQNDSGSESATEGGKLRLTPDTDDDNFVDYEDLTEETVLGWVYDSLVEGEETATEAKTRIETDRTGKVQGQIDRAAAQSEGMPW